MEEKPKIQWVKPRRPLLERLMARGAMSMSEAVASPAGGAAVTADRVPLVSGRTNKEPR